MMKPSTKADCYPIAPPTRWIIHPNDDDDDDDDDDEDDDDDDDDDDLGENIKHHSSSLFPGRHHKCERSKHHSSSASPDAITNVSVPPFMRSAYLTLTPATGAPFQVTLATRTLPGP